MTFIIEVFKRTDGELKSVSKTITDSLNCGLESAHEENALGALLAQSKGSESGTLLFQHGRITYKKK